MRISSIFVVAATVVAASAKNRLDEVVAITNRNIDADIPDLDFALRSLGLDDNFEESGDAEDLIARAADDCAGINLRAWPGKDGKVGVPCLLIASEDSTSFLQQNPDKNKINGAEVGNADCKPANNFNDMQGGFYAYTPKAEKVTKSTDPKSGLVKKIVSKKQQEVGIQMNVNVKTELTLTLVACRPSHTVRRRAITSSSSISSRVPSMMAPVILHLP